ncbi:MAG: hypothetical protein ACJAS3_002880 [Roseivirga sp.]|jgi:hypothetical protein
MNNPNFLCIGASKAGTTGLHEQFMKHNEIWVPFVKELHYFDHKEVKRWVNSIDKQTAFEVVKK